MHMRGGIHTNGHGLRQSLWTTCHLPVICQSSACHLPVIRCFFGPSEQVQKNPDSPPSHIRGLELIPTLVELNLSGGMEITDVICLQSCRALKQLDLDSTNVTDASIRGLELIHTLEVLSLEHCENISDVSFLQCCCALKKLDLSRTNVTDAGIRGLELIAKLEELNLSGCTKVHDLSALRNRPGLRIVAP
jgi:hypothetical protein